MMQKKLSLIGILSVIAILFIAPIAQADVGQVLFSEDFEACIPGDWSVGNGIWECCLRSEPGDWGGGYFYAGTVCGGNYPRYTDSRLISPEIDLTGVVPIGDEEIVLRFWHWFYYYNGADYGVVQISVYDAAAESWKPWADIGGRFTPASSVWSLRSIDLTAYAGEKVKIAFFHTDNGDTGVRSGWYVDDVVILLKAPDLTWDFECGLDDWSADNGVWGVGMPEAGPGKAYSGWQCAGTVPDGSYPRYTDSRLVSPAIVLDCEEDINLRFWHWFDYYNGADYGVVQISVYEAAAESWSTWTDIGGPFTPVSSVWSFQSIDLTAYAGEKVKIAFFHTDNGDTGIRSGWYVDHIRIECAGEALFPHFCECDLDQDGDCDMSDYFLFGGEWGLTDCGTPAGSGLPPNDCECDLDHDGDCDMSDYLRFGSDWGKTDCLLCFD
jgi:hypothetical protein